MSEIATQIMFITMVGAVIAFGVLFWGVILGDRNTSMRMRKQLELVAERVRGHLHPPHNRAPLQIFSNQTGRDLRTNEPYVTKQFDGKDVICLYFPSPAEGRGWTGAAVLVTGHEAQIPFILLRRDDVVHVAQEHEGEEFDIANLPDYRLIAATPGEASRLLHSPKIPALLAPEGEPAITELYHRKGLLEVRVAQSPQKLSVASLERLMTRATSLAHAFGVQESPSVQVSNAIH